MLNTRGEKLQEQRLKVEKMTNDQHGFEKEMTLCIYVDHNNKRSLLGTWRKCVLQGRDVWFVTKIIYQGVLQGHDVSFVTKVIH